MNLFGEPAFLKPIRGRPTLGSPSKRPDVAHPDHAEIDKARSSIVELMREEYGIHSVGKLDPYEFGNAVAPLVNALAALSLMEKQDDRNPGIGEASRSDD